MTLDVYLIYSSIGGLGTIIKTTNGGLTFANNISNAVPEKYMLMQNYPNPFNPITKIKFDVSKSEM